MESAELRRLILRHRHVGPMLSVLLAGTDARVTISDIDGEVILDRQSGTGVGAAEQHPITVEGRTVGWVQGPRPSASIAAVLSYAASREADKRALAAEALDRYRELSLIYDLSESLGASLDVDEVVAVAVAEASRLPTGGEGFVLLREGPDATRLDGGILGSVLANEAEIVNDVEGDPRTSEAERGTASLVAAPLDVRGERIGVIGASSPTRVDYKASDLKAISAIASLAAPAIAQATAHEASVRDR